MDRQREDALRDLLGYGERNAAREVLIHGLLVQRERVEDRGGDALARKRLADRVALLGPGGGLGIDLAPAAVLGGELESPCAAETAAVDHRPPAPRRARKLLASGLNAH